LAAHADGKRPGRVRVDGLDEVFVLLAQLWPTTTSGESQWRRVRKAKLG
jgi:hypothetical protein